MNINLTVIGLIMDAIGFLIVFTYGGFNVGVFNIVGEQSVDKKYWKWLGAALVIGGFVLQAFSASGN